MLISRHHLFNVSRNTWWRWKHQIGVFQLASAWVLRHEFDWKLGLLLGNISVDGYFCSLSVYYQRIHTSTRPHGQHKSPLVCWLVFAIPRSQTQEQELRRHNWEWQVDWSPCSKAWLDPPHNEINWAYSRYFCWINRHDCILRNVRQFNAKYLIPEF